MTNDEILQAAKDAGFFFTMLDTHRMPDYLCERIDTTIDLLRKELIGEEK